MLFITNKLVNFTEMKALLITLASICFSVNVFAQQTITLSGILKDKRGEVLPGAGVYVSGYKIATISDNKGKFHFNLKPGNYDILVQLIGYNALNKNVLIADKPVHLTITLQESVTQLAEVTIKADSNRLRYINLFKGYFIGTTPNAALCNIVNTDVLNISYNRDTRILSANTTDFLIIENRALGYKIKYLLNDFQYDYGKRIVYYEGYPTYEDLKGSESKKRKWAQKRLEAYHGSAQHFFTSLYQNRSTEEGFIINKLIRKANPDKPADSVIKENIRRITAARAEMNKNKTDLTSLKVHLGLNEGDSLNYWMKKRNLPDKISVLGREVIKPDTLVHIHNENIKKIDFTDILYIIYTKEKEVEAYKDRIGLSISRPPEIGDDQISLINLQIRPVFFYKNGSIYNAKSMLYEGYWGWEKIADSVPMDYVPSR